MRKRNINEKELIKIAKSSRSMLDASKKLGIPSTTFRRNAKRLGVYKTNQGCKGIKKNNSLYYTKKSFISDALVYGKKRSSKKTKEILIKLKIKKEVCEICGQLPIWNKEKLTLQLHHIDGNCLNNSLDNLIIVCPNCHTQTKFWGFKNRHHV